MSDTDVDDNWHLTPRERNVLIQASLGKSNREIGEALSIAEQTVKNHLGNAMRKLSLNDRTHAVVVAIGRGLIPLPVAPDVHHEEADEASGAVPRELTKGD